MNRNSSLTKIYVIIFALVLFSIYMYSRTSVCSFTLFPDELGYWATAAALNGYDWSDVVSLGSYYSFGYGLLLYPILHFSKDAVSAYHAAMALNFILQGLAAVLVYKILRMFFDDKNELEVFFTSVFAVAYPAWLFFSQTTMAEALLMFLFVLAAYLLVEFARRDNWLDFALLTLTVLYMYAVHMRCVGIVGSLLLVLIFMSVQEHKYIKYTIVFAVSALIGFLIVAYLKGVTVEYAFSKMAEGHIAVNTYEAQGSKIGILLSFDGIAKLLEGLFGKAFYIFAATFGTIIYAIRLCLSKIKIKSWQSYFGVFLFLSVIVEALISSLYFIRGTRIDNFFYGRYMEFVLPLLLGVGILGFEAKKDDAIYLIISNVVIDIIAVVLYFVITNRGIATMRGFMVIGISFFLEEPFVLKTYLIKTCIYIWAVSFFVFAIRRVATGNRTFLISVLIIAEIAAAIYSSSNYTYAYNKTHFVDKQVADKIIDVVKEDDTIYFLRDDEPLYIDTIQMFLRDKTIHVIYAEDLGNVDINNSLILTYRWSTNKDELYKQYDRKMITDTYCLFYQK